MILYYAQAYRKYSCSVLLEKVLTHEAYQKAQNLVRCLWTLGFEVFSPIAYSHPLRMIWDDPADITHDDWVKHDLAFAEHWLQVRICECNACRAGFDNKLTMIFDDDCLTRREIYFNAQAEDYYVDMTKSKGCDMESTWAKDHSVRQIRAYELVAKAAALNDCKRLDERQQQLAIEACKLVCDHVSK